jgi:hypothetical protein
MKDFPAKSAYKKEWVMTDLIPRDSNAYETQMRDVRDYYRAMQSNRIALRLDIPHKKK